MTHLLDTDTCVFWLRGRPSVRERLQAVAPEAVAISIVTLAELHYGAECSDRPASNHNAIDDFIAALSIVDIDMETARAFGEIKAELRRSGALIPFPAVCSPTASQTKARRRNTTRLTRRYGTLRPSAPTTPPPATRPCCATCSRCSRNTRATWAHRLTGRG